MAPGLLVLGVDAWAPLWGWDCSRGMRPIYSNPESMHLQSMRPAMPQPHHLRVRFSAHAACTNPHRLAAHPSVALPVYMGTS
jgi:hypothetical protein